MKETRVQSLGQGDPLEKEMVTRFSILAWRIPLDREAWWGTIHGVAESDTAEQLNTTDKGSWNHPPPMDTKEFSFCLKKPFHP